MPQIDLGEIKAEVLLKDIKNIHLSVNPPHGKVRISAPLRMDLETIRLFAISRISWIRKQQQRLQGQEREAPREFRSRESHYFLGKRYLLKVVEKNEKPGVELQHSHLVLRIRPGTDTAQRREILQEWYREQVKSLAIDLIASWEEKMGVQVKELGVKRMKTKWGTCNPEAQRIWINLELAKKPVECLEYIVVHEMVHLLERSHNQRFVAYMNHFLPQWPHLKEELNRLPVSHESWKY
jgi:predicted metal-dependent hydrolase